MDSWFCKVADLICLTVFCVAGVNCNKKELHVQQAMVMQASTLQESASDILKQSVAKVRNSSEMVIQSSGKMKQPSSACLLHGSDLLIAPPTPEKSQKRQRTSQSSMCHIDLPDQELVSEAQSHPTSLANGMKNQSHVTPYVCLYVVFRMACPIGSCVLVVAQGLCKSFWSLPVSPQLAICIATEALMHL